MRTPIIAGNWKMYKTDQEAFRLASDLKIKLEDVAGVTVVICPPLTSLSSAKKALENSSILLGAQNMHWEEKGAYTGEVSPAMLLTAGCKYVIIGHSERRTYFHETNGSVNLKVKAALKFNLCPIICLGETLQQREANKTEEIVEVQVEGAFKGLSAQEAEKTVIAYEPIWAIGTGKTATPEQANEVHLFIRQILASEFGKECAGKINILYGGSVKPENSKELLDMPEIDGALVGGASLDTESFEKIVRSAIGS
ncbi:MAG: triose-phosphate isomerase [candidate division Zixibacteria bacterium]|nr:triose-phosphate isomerase [candidate division Zixibacteria bacterium]